MKPRLIKLSYFMWIVPVFALWLTYQAYGLPHAIWAYSWVDNGHGMTLSVPRIYTRCRFIGPYGEFDVAADRGRCAWVRFFKAGMR